MELKSVEIEIKNKEVKPACKSCTEEHEIVAGSM
jgi:hypothetical protein